MYPLPAAVALARAPGSLQAAKSVSAIKKVTLYGMNGSHFVLKALHALDAKKIPYFLEFTELDKKKRKLPGTPARPHTNPKGFEGLESNPGIQVPVAMFDVILGEKSEQVASICVADSDRILQFLDDVHVGGVPVKYSDAVGAASTKQTASKKTAAYAPFFPLQVEAPAADGGVKKGDEESLKAAFQCRQSFKAFNAMGGDTFLQHDGDKMGMGFSSDRARALNLLF